MSLEVSPFPFLELLAGLKDLKRSGWVRRGVPAPTESVADHMYLLSMMCRMAPGFDEETREKAVMMALIHDIGETLTGDITPFDGVTKEEKRIREEMAIEFLACTIRPSNPQFADMLLELWNEYEAGKTLVAQLVKQLDKLEAMRQALTYEKRSGLDLSEFMGLKDKIKLKELKPWVDTLLLDYQNLKSTENADIVVIFVSGGPGVGKGTQCMRAAKELGFCHISVGDLLREEAKNPSSPYVEFIPESIKKSVLLPAQLTTQLLKQRMQEAQAEGKHNFLLDGFPRSIEQAKDFESKICARNSTICLDCSEEVMSGRLTGRAKSSDRIDDNAESILNRLRTFNANNLLVKEYLSKRGPVVNVESDGSVDEVYERMCAAIKYILSPTAEESASRSGL